MDEQIKQAFDLGFLRNLEHAIETLPQATREALYRPCAVSCVQSYVLPEQQRQFAECGEDLDAQYTRYGRSGFFFADIIQPGHVYEIGYPRCLCPVTEGNVRYPACHCECSRQSILHTLHTLLPDKQIDVQLLHTILTGGNECRFRVTVEG